MSVNRFGVKKLPYECNWIFESVQYGRWKEWRPYCVKRCPNRDKCKPPDKKKKGDVYKLHPGSIKPYNPPKYRKVGYRGSIRQEVNQATLSRMR